MDDPASCRHQVDVARPDHQFGAETVAVLDLTVEEVGDGGKADMRMRLDVEGFTGAQQRRAHAVEEDEGADEATLTARQRAADSKVADVARSRDDQVLDGVAGKAIAGLWICSGEEGHGGLL
jgi:hypothetical protein